MNIEQILKVLKSIANNYSKSSEEYKALEIAAKSLVMVNADMTLEKLLEKFDGKLTKKQKKHLKDMNCL